MAETFSQLLQGRLFDALAKTSIADDLPDDLDLEVSAATNPQFGDYQANAAMVLAKKVGKNPRELATEIVESFDGSDLCETPEIAGPGFINFRLTTDCLESRLTKLISDTDQLGVEPIENPQRVVIDFSAPNVAKPMHVGHIRSTFLGDALARIARFLGHDVITDNHIGDWGTQFGMILWGWKNLLDQDALEKEPLEELVRVYKAVNEKQKDDDAIAAECRNELVKLQQGDEENRKIWQTCVELSKNGLQKIYDLLGIEFDHWFGESFYNDHLGPLVEKLIAENIATESDGAIVVFSDGSSPEKEDPFLKNENDEWVPQPALIQKTDGGFLYATTDLATIDHRIENLKADAAWYVVGAPQQLHFDQIFEIAKRRGQDIDLQFIPFGSILGKDRKMYRTRTGESVGLIDVIDESIERARKIVEEKNPDLSGEDKAGIATTIGIGAIKYAELSQFRMTDYIFDWDTMLALKGNTAPYLLNAYVRTRAIFRKLGNEFEGAAEISLTEQAEKNLALKLMQYGESLPTVLEDFRPNLLANYLYELATTYHKFWEACPVLRAEGAVRDTRLALCELTSRVLKHGLGLLGIRTTERM
ncbi:MAG: arginine--tRNA ligase [Verrucomicrobiales bacterium]|nr:arginine--tRNA ligase [Verrucomicrobiales bacterium]